MSIKVMARVWEDFPGGGGSELLTMLALADWSDDSGYCWPSIQSVALKTRLSRSQAQRVLHGLRDIGFVSVVGNERGGKPGVTCRYRINLEALTGRTDATGSVHATGRTDAQDGSHGCAKRGSADATQTVSEPSGTVNKNSSARKNAFDPLAHLLNLGVQQQVAGDWLALRKAKKAIVTATVLQTIVGEATKAGITLDAALSECCARGWQGFKSSWLADTPRKGLSAEPLAKQHYGQGGAL